MMNHPYGYSPRSGPTVDRGFVRRPAYRGGMTDRGYSPLPRSGDCGCAPRPIDHGVHPRLDGNASLPMDATPAAAGRCGCEARGQKGMGGHGGQSGRTDNHHRCGLCGGQGGDHPHDGGCGCESHNSGGCAGNNCKQLMEQIRAVDFALYETVLYLDVYPHSCDALETYHKLKARREELYSAYESTCGPITAFGNKSTTSWDWTDQPAPWEYDAN